MPNFVDYAAQQRIIDVLTAHDGGPMLARDIASAVQTSLPAVTARLQAMHVNGQVAMKRNPSGPNFWTLAKADNIAPPRTYTTKAVPFTGVDWSVSTMRPGALDALKYPSRRADGLHPYRAPYLNGASK